MIGNNIISIGEFKMEMMKVFEMSNLGLMTYYLGMYIKQNQDEVFVCQRKYGKQILKKFHMEECKSMNTPMNIKEKFNKEDGTERADDAYFRSLNSCLMYLTTINQTS